MRNGDTCDAPEEVMLPSSSGRWIRRRLRGTVPRVTVPSAHDALAVVATYGSPRMCRTNANIISRPGVGIRSDSGANYCCLGLIPRIDGTCHFPISYSAFFMRARGRCIIDIRKAPYFCHHEKELKDYRGSSSTSTSHGTILMDSKSQHTFIILDASSGPKIAEWPNNARAAAPPHPGRRLGIGDLPRRGRRHEFDGWHAARSRAIDAIRRGRLYVCLGWTVWAASGEPQKRCRCGNASCEKTAE